MVEKLLGAVEKIFGFLKNERDYKQKVGRLHIGEYKVLKKAVRKAHKAFKYDGLLKKEKNSKLVKKYQKYKLAHIRAFYNLMVKE